VVSDTQQATIRAALQRTHGRMAMLHALARLDLPDAWIAAGAVRNAVWDTLHAYPDATPLADVDVIWFDASHASEAQDRGLEKRLGELLPGLRWSVKNQARMHLRNGDAPYLNCLDAMRRWPETATCVAARLARDGTIELCSAHGFDDLLGCILRPTPHLATDRMVVFHERIAGKRWRQIWPRLAVAESPTDCHAAASVIFGASNA
jgi:uncharacterized protein